MRAVAVVMVLLFHLRVPGFGAGYLGVDVFFVLSGFLITSLLVAEMEQHGGIALVAFWSRRVRRLLPALAVLLLVVALVTSLTATFTERASIRGDLLASTAYVANWRLIATSSYFANTGVESPIQHTWTLAVEEQFYLLWPLALAGMMLLLRKARSGTMLLAVIGVVASAVAMAWLYAPDSVERAYMGTDARIFEPLLGAVGAILVVSPQFRATLERHGRLMLGVGALLVLAGMVLLHPGAALYFYGGALGFSLATLMIVVSLWVGQGGWAGRALSWGPIAWIGVISYGMYLWHWPIILWLGVRHATGFRTVLLGVAAAALTVVAAALSYYFVERPIRTGRRGTHGRRGWQVRRPWAALAAMPVVLLLVASFSVAATRVPPLPPGTPVLMLVGDSVPERLTVPFELAAASHGWRMVSAVHGGCSVTGETNSDTTGVPLHEANACAQTIVPEQEDLIRQAHPDVVLWWDRWVLYDFLTADGEHVKTGTARFWALRRAGLDAAVHRLTADGAKVVFVGVEPPGAGICHGRPIETCGERLSFRVEHYDDITLRWNGIMQQYAKRNPDLAAFVDITDDVCHDAAVPCNDLIDGVPARPDGTHYEGAGEDLVTTLLADDVAPWMTTGGSVSPTLTPSPSPGMPVLMVVGDSVPERLAIPLEDAAARHGWRMVSAALGGCSVTGETNTERSGLPLHESKACAETIAPRQDEMIRKNHPDVVLWWDRWVLYDFLTADGEHVKTGTDRFWMLRRAGLDAAVHRLTSDGAKVAFVGVEPPGAGICHGRPIETCGRRLRFRVQHYDDITSRWNSIMRHYAKRNPDLAVYIDIRRDICHDDVVPCDDLVDGVPARPDGTHYEGVGIDLVTTVLMNDVVPWMTPGV